MVQNIKDEKKINRITDITMMLSLSFFYSSNTMLDALINTFVEVLDVGGHIRLLTIDGNSMVNHLKKRKDRDSFSILGSNVTFYNRPGPLYGSPVDFFLPGDNIVEHQREYLVFLETLEQKLKVFGFTKEDYSICDPESYKKVKNPILLSEGNRDFVKLYSSIVFKNTNEKLFKTIKTKLKGTNGNYVHAGPNEITENVPAPPKDEILDLHTDDWPNDFWWNYCSKNDIPTTFVVDKDNLPKGCTPSITSPKKKKDSPKKKKDSPKKKKDSPKKKEDSSSMKNSRIEMLSLGKENEFDDTYAQVTNTWIDNMYRIATIGGGNCFFHAVLKAVFPEYQKSDGAQREIISEKFRRDLAVLITKEHPNYKNHTYWDIVGNGAFPRLLMIELQDTDLVTSGEMYDYSMNGLKYFLNSTFYF